MLEQNPFDSNVRVFEPRTAVKKRVEFFSDLKTIYHSGHLEIDAVNDCFSGLFFYDCLHFFSPFASPKQNLFSSALFFIATFYLSIF